MAAGGEAQAPDLSDEQMVTLLQFQVRRTLVGIAELESVQCTCVRLKYRQRSTSGPS